ncbi:hypothetical protein ACFL2O_01705 [Thermodesulfobacteriota bacterium]
MEIISKRNRIKIQWLVVRGQKIWGFRHISRWWCFFGVRRVSRLLLKMPSVEAVYSRHTRPGSPSFVPGHSDLDVTLVLSENASRDPEQIEAVSRRVDDLSWFHFYLSPEDVRFSSRNELARLTRNFAAPFEPLYTPDDWVLLAGEEVRSEKSGDFPSRRMPWHPEFNRWWQHVLQVYLHVKRPGLEGRYLRVFYRSALRQQLQFHAALGKVQAKPNGHVGDEMVDTAFEHDPETLELLEDIKRRDFWVRNPWRLKKQILFAVFQSASDFFSKFPAHPELDTEKAGCSKEIGRHESAYDALKSRLEQCAHLTSMLRGVMAYPVPYFSPYFYNVDMVIPDEPDPEQFGEILDTAYNEFKGKEFILNGHQYAITYVPEGVLKKPLVYLGSPYPFLKEHIKRYGICLTGQEPPALEGSWSHQDLTEWCRIFLPYHRITLSRRVEHSSRGVCFLGASLHLCWLYQG